MKCNAIKLFLVLISTPCFLTGQETVVVDIPHKTVSVLEVTDEKSVLLSLNGRVMLLDSSKSIVFDKKGNKGIITPDGTTICVLGSNKDGIPVFYKRNGERLNIDMKVSVLKHCFSNDSRYYYTALKSGQIEQIEITSSKKTSYTPATHVHNITSLSEIGSTGILAIGGNLGGEFIYTRKQQAPGTYTSPHISWIRAHSSKNIYAILHLASDFSVLEVVHEGDTTRIEKKYEKAYPYAEYLGHIKLETMTSASMITTFDIAPSGKYVLTYDQAKNLNYWSVDGTLISSYTLPKEDYLIRFLDEHTVLYYDDGLQFLSLK